MKRIVLLLVILNSLITLSYSQAVGEWSVHMAYHNATVTIPVGNLIYVLSDNSLYSYDTEDTSIFTYDKANYLSDTEISHIAYSNYYKTLLIVYANSNIDLLINDNEVYNLPDFMNKSMMEDKTLNNIYLLNEYAYLSTNFGIVIVNLNKKEITNTYNLGKEVYSTLLVDNTIYAATKTGILRGDLTDNLLDNDNWDYTNTDVGENLIYFDNKIIISKKNDGMYLYNEDTNTTEKIITGNYQYINMYEEKLIAGNTTTVVIFDKTITSRNTIQLSEETYCISLKGNIYWSANGNKGLNGYRYDESSNELVRVISSIIPNSPRRNYFHYMTIADNRLLVAGGSLNYNNINREGTLMMYEEGEWSSFQEDGISDITGLKYRNLTAVIQDPLNPEIHYASSASQGLYKFVNKEFVELYSLTNSTLQTAVPGYPDYIRLNGIQYDSDHNLWMLNSEVENIVNVLKKDGTWFSFNHPEIEKIITFERILFDRRGWMWATSMRLEAGIFCLNTNNTLENISDDKSIFIQKFAIQDGNTIKYIQPDYVHCIVEDKNGVIWIGTDVGPILINNPTEKIFDPTEETYFTQIKVPRNDGTNTADLLLENEAISCIAIDGANRKWIGTQNSGIYLVSEDGIETIHHFTSDNSPLLSNTIESMVIDPKTGIVYVGTTKGLVSYRSDATEAENTFSEEAHAFPNPVYPDYEGLITVTGLIKDSNVKITDSNGNLIYTNTSVGGQFTWDGKNRNGNRVASGVYFVIAANTEGKEGIITKILMIK